VNQELKFALDVTLLGIIATALLDLWALARKTLSGAAMPDYAMVGRWVGHMFEGRFRHDSIAHARPVQFESLLGWGVHYATGIVFAWILMMLSGAKWLCEPALLPALVVGVGSVAAPYLLLQPGMGLGIAASRAPRPKVARLRSLMTHTVFGLSLYIAGWTLVMIQRGLERI
jgi:hypothetical protein